MRDLAFVVTVKTIIDQNWITHSMPAAFTGLLSSLISQEAGISDCSVRCSGRGSLNKLEGFG